MVRALEASAKAIDRTVVRKWVEELLIDKTFAGLKFQEAILKKIDESKMEVTDLQNLRKKAKELMVLLVKERLVLRQILT